MDESDFSTFERAFRRASGAFRLRMRPQEMEDMTRTYFRVLEVHRLDVVLDAGKRCIETMKHFPKAAEWLAAIAPERRDTLAPDVRQMGVSEVEEKARAHVMRYTDEPCNCIDCQMAGVETKPLRYVPTLVDGIEDRAFNPRRNEIEVTGHWAHGAELARWWVAHDAFFGLSFKPAFKRHLALVLREREPGEDDE